MFDVDANAFRAVALMQSDDKEKQGALSGVRIEPHPVVGVLLIATDGKRMIVVHDASGRASEAKTVRLESAMLRQCKADRFDRAPRRVVNADDKEVWIANAEGTKLMQQVQRWNVGGSFFAWRDLLEAHGLYEPAAGAEVIWFNPDFLADFGKASAILSGKAGENGISIEPNGSHAALVRFAGLEQAFGIIMPCEGYGYERGVPRFAMETGPFKLAA